MHFLIATRAMACDGDVFIWNYFDSQVGRITCFDFFSFSEGEEDEERPELASASTEESVAPGESIVL